MKQAIPRLPEVKVAGRPLDEAPDTRIARLEEAVKRLAQGLTWASGSGDVRRLAAEARKLVEGNDGG